VAAAAAAVVAVVAVVEVEDGEMEEGGEVIEAVDRSVEAEELLHLLVRIERDVAGTTSKRLSTRRATQTMITFGKWLHQSAARPVPSPLHPAHTPAHSVLFSCLCVPDAELILMCQTTLMTSRCPSSPPRTAWTPPTEAS
jgi:hypothetical protein